MCLQEEIQSMERSRGERRDKQRIKEEEVQLERSENRVNRSDQILKLPHDADS